MSTAVRSIDMQATWQSVRFVINGVTAAVVHFSVLSFNLFVLHIPSAGIANLIAAIVGITVSFFGSRWFVFRAQEDPIFAQFSKFSLLYASTALLHATVLWIWADICAWDYRVGFLLATFLQTVLSFFGNKLLVFKR